MDVEYPLTTGSCQESENWRGSMEVEMWGRDAAEVKGQFSLIFNSVTAVAEKHRVKVIAHC